MNELSDLIGRRVDLVEDGTLLPFAAETANQDKKLIYERSC
jgi:predicted nucleotidyltransferase